MTPNSFAKTTEATFSLCMEIPNSKLYLNTAYSGNYLLCLLLVLPKEHGHSIFQQTIITTYINYFTLNNFMQLKQRLQTKKKIPLSRGKVACFELNS